MGLFDNRRFASVVLALAALCVLVGAGCSSSSDEADESTNSDSDQADTAQTESSPTVGAGDPGDPADPGDPGDPGNPGNTVAIDYGPVSVDSLEFGKTVGFDLDLLGEQWTVSIDDVISVPAPEAGVQTCVAVLGSATLDSLDNGLTSSGIAFPEVALVREGTRIRTFDQCGMGGLTELGMVQAAGLAITEGTSIEWFQTYSLPDDSYDFVAIRQQVFTNGGGQVDAGERREPVSEGGPEDGPYSFGEAHTRPPGPAGEGWSVSIDDVVSLPVLSGESPTCLAVLGTATLDSLSTGFASTGFSFPEVLVIQDGMKADGQVVCDPGELHSQGFQENLGAQITQGTAMRWYWTVGVDRPDYDVVAIEEVPYVP